MGVPTVNWQGEDRRIVRAARAGDEGFDPEAPTLQVVIKIGDGSEIVVPYEGDGGGGIPPTEPLPTVPPTVVDAPYVSQSGSTMNCTMGNWNGEPDTYAYQWHMDEADVGTDSSNYTVAAGDVGNAITCTVTASNALGSASSTSNSVIAS